jgi:hypothetical protein
MDRENISIGSHINRLARETGASSSFVSRVRDLFSRKGISLEADGGPYAEALENAFVRERMIRARAEETRERIEKLQDQLVEVSTTFQSHLERLKKIQSALNRKFPTGPSPRSRLSPAPGSAPAARRPRKVRLEVERGFLVPGPEDPQ